MIPSLKPDQLSAEVLRERVDHSLRGDAFIDSCVSNARQLHEETEDRSALLFYAMLALGRFTKGTNTIQRFSELYNELGNDHCADIVNAGNYTAQDLAFYWSTSIDLSHLFTASAIAPVKTFSSSEHDRQLSKTIMSEDWNDYTFHEVDKMPASKKPRHWGLYDLQDATIAYDTAEFVVLDHLARPVINLCSTKYQHVYFTAKFGDYILNSDRSEGSQHIDGVLEEALMIQDLIRQPNFCHWLLDQLPRLRHLEKSQRIILYKLAPFMKNMLELMDIGPERVYELKERAVIQVGKLTIESSMANEFYHPCQDVSRDLIDFIESSLSAPSENSVVKPIKHHVYLSRNRYEGRRISNESALLEVLEKYDFHTVYPEELSVPEQISLFRNAEVIVSPHGASLASTIFCRQVTLIEIFNQNYGTPTFFLIAKLLGFPYQHLLGTNPLLSDKEKQNVGLANLQYEDMEVDLEKLEQCLAKVFSNYPSRRTSRFLPIIVKRWIQRLAAKYS